MLTHFSICTPPPRPTPSKSWHGHVACERGCCADGGFKPPSAMALHHSRMLIRALEGFFRRHGRRSRSNVSHLSALWLQGMNKNAALWKGISGAGGKTFHLDARLQPVKNPPEHQRNRCPDHAYRPDPHCVRTCDSVSTRRQSS